MTAAAMPVCCLSCAFFHEGTSPAFPEADGMCRRYAPQGPARSHQQGWQVFPPMMKHHWCGDYQELPGLAEVFATVISRQAA